VVGGQAATIIGQRAQDGARKLYQIITEKKSSEADKKSPEISKPETNKKSPDHTGSIGGDEGIGAEFAERKPRDTLTADDLAVEWRGAP
jgi:hypothetical protein